ncbi:type I methionyl aminopeptidase [Hamadaea sp. NPDC051192]|uniref:type I methionyl aminopeptidase n=1 Tax=Hamadaea sp. NPDC051192 TaxID=3154940 RepID=UPI003424D53B
MIRLKSLSEIATMREAGRVVARTLAAVAEAARAGVSLSELDELAAGLISAAGANPSFLGYRPTWASTRYPGVLCLSVNDAIVHGIPNGRVLRDGDLLSIDCGAYVEGFHADAAITVGVGDLDDRARHLSETTRLALEEGIAVVAVGGRLSDISHAVETVARGAGYGVPPNMGGHGIGTKMHEDPHLANTGRPGRGVRLREGMVLAIEPMLIESGRDRARTARDGWTVLTGDGSRAAHWEHSVAVTGDGPVILTLP